MRPCASAMEIGRLNVPGAPDAVTRNEKMLSPAVTSPSVPASLNAWSAAPPIAVRSPVTVTPLLAGGPPAGVTVTVNSDVPPD